MQYSGSSYILGILLLVAACAVAIAAVLQTSEYRRGRSIISRGQLVLRLVTAVLLLLIIAMIFAGAIYPWPDTPVGKVSELGFWSLLIILAIVVVFLAMADLRQLEREKHLRQAAVYRAIQEAHEETSKEGKD